MKALLIFAFLLTSLLSLQATDPWPELPKTTLQWGTPDTTGQKQLFMNFHTTPGVFYTLEMSEGENALQSYSWFETGAQIYGLGNDVHLPIYTYQPPDPSTHAPVDESFTFAPPLITLLLSPLPSGQGVAVSWCNGNGSYAARQVYPTTNTLSGVPLMGAWRCTDVDMIWSKMDAVATADPTSLNTPLGNYEQLQWAQIQAAMPEILTGTGGATAPVYSGSPPQGTAVSRFFRLRVEYPDSDGDGIPDWMEFAGFNSGGIHYSSNPFTNDSDGDGITDADEWAAGTNPNDATSRPYKVMVVTPAVGDGGSPLNGAVLFYFNAALPANFTLPPTTNLLWHVATTTMPNGTNAPTKTYTLEPVAGTYTILPGRRTVAFLPAQPLLSGLDNQDFDFPKFNYLYDVTTTSTGLNNLIPLTNLPATLPTPTYAYSGDLNGFTTTTLTDTIGPAVMKTSPGWNYVNVDSSAQPTVTWNQPLDPATVNSSHVTLTTTDTNTVVPCTLSFDYGVESYDETVFSVTRRLWKPTLKLKLTPSSALQSDTSYTVTLGTGLKNLKGLPLLNDYSWSFRTRPAPTPIVSGAVPYIVSTTPTAYHQKVSASAFNGGLRALTVIFSEAMNAATLTASTVHLTEHSSGIDQPLTLNYHPASRKLSITVNSLENDKRYDLTLDGGDIQSAGGGTSGAAKPLQGDVSFPFNTSSGDDNNPDHPDGTPDPDGSGDPDQPENVILGFETGDGDAGSAGRLTAKLPNGKTQVVPITAATDRVLTSYSQGFPHGTSFEIDPEFTVGSDGEVEHEKRGCGVRAWLSNSGNTASSTYLVFKESNGTTTFDGVLDGSNGYHIAYCAATIDNGGTITNGPPERLKIAPAEVKDLKEIDDQNDDVLIVQKRSDDDTNINSVAWIESHRKQQDANPSAYDDSDDPVMPHLRAQLVDLPSTYQVQWKFNCKYSRPSGRSKTEDEVNLPADGTTKNLAGGEPWNIYEDYKDIPFFGGKAVLTFRIVNMDGSEAMPEQTFKFRIAGKNPNQARCRKYMDNAVSRLSGIGNKMWYAYAIAKHETEWEGGQHYYNQFLQRGDKYRDAKGKQGIPNWNDDGVFDKDAKDAQGTSIEGKRKPGGYGIEQVTGWHNDENGDVPRGVIWNWKTNVDEGLNELVHHHQDAVDWMSHQTENVSVALPTHTVVSVFFKESTSKTMIDAVAIKNYNGHSKRNAPDTYSDPVGTGGFSYTNITPTEGRYCYFDTTEGAWRLSRFSSLARNYLTLVCEQIEP